jgi:hypothetical protein
MSIALRALLLFRRTSEPKGIAIAFDGEIYPVRLRRHSRARRYTLRIHAASRDVVLTMPPRGSVKQAREFAEKNGAWIVARLRRLPDAMPFAHGTHLPLRGVSHRIDQRKGTRGTVWIEISADMRLLCVAGETPHLPRRVRDFLNASSKRDLSCKSGGGAGLWCHYQTRFGARSVEPVGLVLVNRRAFIFMAAHSHRHSCSTISLRTKSRMSSR